MGFLGSLFLVFFLTVSNHGVKYVRMLSKEEDLELEKQVKLLNKPSIKTIQDEEGDMYDCVNIRKQPAFDHPLLKNHQIKLRPSSQPKKATTTSTRFRGSRTHLKGMGCPQGTVPIRRIQKEDLARAKSLLQLYSTATDPLASDGPVIHSAVFRSRLTTNYYTGLEASFNIWNPKVDVKEQWSSAEISVENGPKQDFNSIKAGWTVSPELYGDNKTRSYLYWQGQEFLGGCFNLQCAGYVQINQDIPIGSVLPTSKYDELPVEYPLRLYQDQVTKDWWLDHSIDPIIYGYFPRELFPHLERGTPTISLGGMTKRAPNQPSPPMGSGYFPHGQHNEGYFALIKIFIGSDTIKSDPDPSLMETFTDAPKCYNVKDYGDQKGNGYTIGYGGPGNCGT